MKRDVGCVYTEERPCEDTVRGWSLVNHGEASEETKPAYTLTLDFYPHPPERFKPPHLWYLVMATRGN